MKGVYEREGWWYVRIPKGTRQYDRISLNTRDETEARRQAESIRAARRGGVDSNVLWQHLVETFKEEHFPHLKPSTRQTYTWAFVALTPTLFDKPVRSIDNPTLDRFVKLRFAAGLTADGIRSELGALSSILSFAEGRNQILFNPVSKFLKANKTRLRRGEPRVRWLPVAEELHALELLRKYAQESDKGPDARLNLMAAVIIGIDTGLRLAELRQMQWSEIQFAPKAQVWVPKERAKSKKDRWVPLLSRSAKLLRGMYDRALAKAGGDRRKMCKWTFSNDTGDGPRVNFDKALRQFAGTYPDKKRARLIVGPVLKAGLNPFSWHDLRRTCGCRLLQGQRAYEPGAHRKLSMEEVSKWLGHSSISVTERHYAFLTVDTLHEAVGTEETEENLTHKVAQNSKNIDTHLQQVPDLVGTASPDRTGDL